MMHRRSCLLVVGSIVSRVCLILYLACYLESCCCYTMSKAVHSPSTSSSWPSTVSVPKSANVVYRENGELSSVPSMMNYVDPETTVMSTRRNLAGSDSTLEGAIWLPTCAQIHNVRGESITLDENGFELREQKVDDTIDFMDQNDVLDRYYPCCEDLLQSVLEDSSVSGTRVLVKAFDHNVRSSRSNSKGRIKNSQGAAVQNPASLVHADYTRVSAPRRVQDLAKKPKQNDVLKERLKDKSLLDPAMVQEAMAGKRRFALINVWRNICPNGEPVQQMPLACIDAGTVEWGDLRTFQIHYSDRVGENYFCCPQSKHKWCYFPKMVKEEALLLKQWDSVGGIALGNDVDSATSSFTVHSAFLDPTSSPDAPPRRSIEVRCVAIWEKE